MAKLAALDLVSFEAYLDFEETTPEKHELLRGRIVAMAGGGANHDDIIVSLTGMCREALRGKKPCRFVGENRKVRIEASGSGYRPDGAIACPPNDFNPRQGAYDNPKIVFEVLSPATAEFDRTDKADDYKSLPSLEEYVLIESDKARVEVFSRMPDGRWAQRVYLSGAVVRLDSIGIDLPMAELYENAVFTSEPGTMETSS